MTHHTRVGFQGEHGAFSENAGRYLLDRKAEWLPYQDFPALFRALATKKIGYAIIAIENSLAGSVHENYDLLLRYRPAILKEATVRIVHSLIAPRGVPFSAIRRVYSHHMALKQCRRFFQKFRKQLKAIECYDTAGSVKMVTKERLTDSAGIAGAQCATIYGGVILMDNIGDSDENYTRFFLLGPRGRIAGTRKGTKTSLAFVTKNQPGALARCLSCFGSEGINLTKIESKPLFDTTWEYVFYLDFIGNPREPHVARALKKLRQNTENLKILGCYSVVRGKN